MAIIRSSQNGTNKLTVSINGKVHLIDKQDIRFIESIGRKKEIHVGGKAISVYSGMDIMDELGASFFQPHRSFIVNLNYVAGYERCEIELSDGTRVPMSKYKFGMFKTAYKSWTDPVKSQM